MPAQVSVPARDDDVPRVCAPARDDVPRVCAPARDAPLPSCASSVRCSTGWVRAPVWGRVKVPASSRPSWPSWASSSSACARREPSSREPSSLAISRRACARREYPTAASRSVQPSRTPSILPRAAPRPTRRKSETVIHETGTDAVRIGRTIRGSRGSDVEFLTRHLIDRRTSGCTHARRSPCRS